MQLGHGIPPAAWPRHLGRNPAAGVAAEGRRIVPWPPAGGAGQGNRLGELESGAVIAALLAWSHESLMPIYMAEPALSSLDTPGLLARLTAAGGTKPRHRA